jgi:hypothetical protein
MENSGYAMLHFSVKTSYSALIMKKIIAILMLLIFAFGVIVVPTIHRMHCKGKEHSEEKCSICALLSLVFETSNVFVAVVSNESISKTVFPPELLREGFFACRTHSARAPPVI